MSQWAGSGAARVIEGDCREVLAALPADLAQTCITSPPYWGLRDYGVAGQLGLEATPEEYVARMVEVFREVRRVLRPDGTLWLNLGDCYAASSSSNHGRGAARPAVNGRGQVQRGNGWENPPRRRPSFRRDGAPEMVAGHRGGFALKPKDLVGIPWRVAFALQADGWWLRSDIIWAKPNPMPESVTDRPTKAHEYLFLLSKSEQYFYDADAIREPDCGRSSGNGFDRPERLSMAPGNQEQWTPGSGRNRRDVWNISAKPFAGAHFAVMPWDLVEPCVLAGSKPCDVVLDPFAGSGTVGMVARRHGRQFVGAELNPDYARMARERIRSDAPLLNAASEVA